MIHLPPHKPASSLIRSLLASILALQMLLSPIVASAQTRGGAPVSDSPVAYSLKSFQDVVSKFSNADETGILPAALDNYLLKNRQKRRIYKPEKQPDGSWIDVVDREIDLSNPENIPAVSMTNPLLELKLAYSRERKELVIQHWEYDSKQRRNRLTDDHVIEGIEISTTQGDAIVKDEEALVDLPETLGKDKTVYASQAPNLIFFSTDDGVRSILWAQMLQLAFVGKIPSTLIVPSKHIYRVDQLTILTPEVQVRNVKNAKPLAGDLLLRLKPRDSSSGAEETEVIIPHQELLINTATRQMGFLMELQAANPDMKGEFDTGHGTTVAEELTALFAEVSQNQQKFAALKEQILDNPGLDLPMQTLVHLARKSNIPELLQLVHPTKGAIIDLSKQPRHSMEDAQWRADFKHILKARNSGDADLSGKSWRELLISEIPTAQEVRIKRLNQEALQLKNSTKKSFVNRVLSKATNQVKKIVTPKRVAILAAIIGFDWINLHTGNSLSAGIVSLTSHYFGWMLDLPLLGKVLSPAGSFGEYLQESWSATRLALGMGAFFSLAAIMNHLSGIYSNSKKDGLGWQRGFFSYGGRLLARFSYPIQKILFQHFFLELIGRQKNLDLLSDYKLNPFTTPGAFHNPFASKEQVALSRARIQDYIKTIDETDRAKRSAQWERLLRDAVIVSKKEGLDPVVLMLALKQSQRSNLQNFTQTLETVQGLREYGVIAELMVRELTSLTAQTEFPDLDAPSEHYKELTYLAHLIKDQASQRGLQTLKSFEELSRKTFFSNQVLPYVMFGSQPYETYKKYVNFTISPKSSRLAFSGYKEDYSFSLWFYGFTDAVKFGSFKAAHLLQLTPNQLEQILNYGAINGVDVSSTEKGSSKPKNLYLPVHVDQISHAAARPQNMGEGVSAFFKKKPTDPSAKPTLSNTSVVAIQNTFMMNNLKQIQARTLMGVVPKAVLGLADSIAIRELGTGAIIGEFFKSFPKQLVFMGNKLSYGLGLGVDPVSNKLAFASPGSFTPGYAVIWPVVLSFIKNAEGEADLNLAQFLEAHAWIASNDLLEAQYGASLLLEMYARSDVNLPAKYDVPVERYDIELARALAQFSVMNPKQIPAPTQLGQGFLTTMNVIGAFISTVLYVDASNTFYDPNVDVKLSFIKAASTFAVNLGLFYGISKVAPPVVRKAKEVIRTSKAAVKQAFRSCANALTGRRD